jgi:hypothetical protein
MRLESKSVEDAARRNSQHLPETRWKRKPTQRAQSTMPKHMFSQKLKGYPQNIYLVKSMEDAARWNNQHLDEE